MTKRSAAMFYDLSDPPAVKNLLVAARACYTLSVTKVVEAIYSHGVLEPVEALDLPERQRVRLIVQSIDGVAASERPADREAAFARFLKGVQSMNFRSTGPYPTRDELHDRS